MFPRACSPVARRLCCFAAPRPSGLGYPFSLLRKGEGEESEHREKKAAGAFVYRSPMATNSSNPIAAIVRIITSGASALSGIIRLAP